MFGLFLCIIMTSVSSSPSHLHCPGSGCHPAPLTCCFHLLAMLLAASLLSYIMWRLILKLNADGISPSTNIHWLPIAYGIKCKPFCWLTVNSYWALTDLSLSFFSLNSFLPCSYHSSQRERPWSWRLLTQWTVQSLPLSTYTPIFFSHWGLYSWGGAPFSYLHMSICAKSLQSCPTLCDPMDCSTPGPMSSCFLLKCERRSSLQV